MVFRMEESMNKLLTETLHVAIDAFFFILIYMVIVVGCTIYRGVYEVNHQKHYTPVVFSVQNI
jgi:hypothetical protein